jgi:hypothetical protein
MAALLVATPWLEANAATQQQIAEYVCTNIIGVSPCSSIDDKSLWMTDQAWDDTHVARDPDPLLPDTAFPYASTWLVMIDDDPKANFGHPVQWYFVDDASPTHTSVSPTFHEFPPTVWGGGGTGPERPFDCTAYTAGGCAPATSAAGAPVVAGADKDCLRAVLISGGINARKNHGRYATNLRSMYKKLRAAHYKAANIVAYYDNGSPLDLDNADNDNNDATGNDITGNVSEANFRTDIQNWCQTLNPAKDVLVIYTSNHGAKSAGLNLWDWNVDGKRDADEVYTPAELADDTKNCKVFRLFIIMDQCYSGQFTAIATDGNHARTSIYTAASANEPSVCRQYMQYWEQLDPTTTTADNMHASVVTSMAAQQKTCTGGTKHCERCTQNTDCDSNKCEVDGQSTPQKAEGTANNGNTTIATCPAGVPLFSGAGVAVLLSTLLATGSILLWRRRARSADR